MNKLKNKSGMTLMEMMVSILILVMLVVAMGTGMNSGMRIYEDAMFESNSASLANIINTTLSDILRYCEVTTNPSASGNDPQFFITNLDYGIVDAHFVLSEEGSGSILQVQNTKTGVVIPLINEGASTGLEINEFIITFHTAQDRGYFDIKYTIISSANDAKSRQVTSVVRLLNTD